MIRDHGDAVEADLLFRGVDLLDLWRPGSSLTLRRLALLIPRLPADASLWVSLDAEEKKSLKPTTEQIRARQAHYSGGGRA